MDKTEIYLKSERKLNGAVRITRKGSQRPYAFNIKQVEKNLDLVLVICILW